MEERYELIDGIPYMMAAPVVEHQRVSGRVYAAIFNFLDEHGNECEVFAAPFDVYLFDMGKQERNVYQPDIVVICDTKKIADGKRCNGAPEFVIEILSESTSSLDWFVKLNKYRAAGVREYWIVDPAVRKIYVHLLNEVGEYVTTEYSEGDVISVATLAGCEIDLSKIFQTKGEIQND